MIGHGTGRGCAVWVRSCVRTGAFLFATSVSAQQTPTLLDRPARLEVVEVTLEAALRELQRTSGVALAFSPDLLPSEATITCACRTATVRQALDRLLRDTDLEYVARSRQILIGRRGAEDAVTEVTVLGSVVELGSDRPIPAADVQLRSPERRSLTGGDGRFVLTGVAPGVHRIRVQAFGYAETEATVTVGAHAVQGVRIELERAPIPLAEIVITPGSYGVLEVSPAVMGSAITRDDIEATPQIGDDVFRTLARLPGVATEDVSAQLNVRGGKASDMLVRLDGLELFEPYHLRDLDGVFGIVDVQSLGSIDLITGGFPADFGDKWGGVFDMHSRNPPAAGTRTTVGMSLSSLSLISQGTFDEGRGQWLTSLRRGFLEYVLAVTDVDDDLRPAYWDVFGRGQYLLSEKHLITLDVLAAGDDVHWQDDGTNLRVDSDWANTYAWAGWEASLTPSLRAKTMLSAGRVKRDRGGRGGNPGDGVFVPVSSYVSDRASFAFWGLKQDWQVDVSGDALVKAGFDLRGSGGEYDYFSSATFYDVDGLGNIVMPTRSRNVALEPHGTELGMYAALRGRAAHTVTWEAGLRYDHESHTGDSDVAPRLLLRWDIDQGSTFRATWGRYYESQRLHELNVADGEMTYGPSERAEQLALGLERRFDSGVTGRVEAYHRTVSDPRPIYVNLSREINPVMEVSGDRTRIDPTRGRALGLELLLDRDRPRGMSWSTSYAWARAEQEVDGRWAPQTHDQLHTLNVHGSYRTDTWQLSASWHYHTGWPVTRQYLDATVSQGPDGEIDAYVVTRGFGALNAERLPAYHRLDVRATRRFRMGRSALEIYLDVFNLYDQDNLRGYAYSLNGNPAGYYTTERSNGEEMMPILPTVGFRWVF